MKQGHTMSNTCVALFAALCAMYCQIIYEHIF